MRSQVRSQEDAIRDARRAKSLRQYFRRERRHPLPDEEVHLQSNGDYVLQPFDLVSENGGEGEADAGQDLTIQFPLDEVVEAEQHSVEDNYWGDYQNGRRLHPFSEIGARDEFLFFQSVAQASPENETLILLVHRLEECLARQAHISVTGRSITEDDQQYIFENIRIQLDEEVSQLPTIDPAQHLPEPFEAVPINVEEEEEDYREPEAPEMLFYDWTLRSYEQESTHNEGLSTQDALEQDLDNYDWYLRRYCTDLQVNDFQQRRVEIATRAFEFDHPNLESLPFSEWLAVENQVRVRNGMERIERPVQALDIFCTEVIWQQSQEVRDAFADSRARHFEENRREFYGHARDDKCPLLERLKDVRARTLKMMSWVEDNLPDLLTAQTSLDRICCILTTRIAMEVDPTDEQWAEILDTGRKVMEEIKEARKQPDRENNWRNLYSYLTENWDHESETQVGNVDDAEADGEIHEALQVSSGFLSEETR